MKAVILITIILSTLLTLTNYCNAQAYKAKTFSGSIGADVLFTETKLSSTHKTGAGVSLKSEYVFSEHASITINTGYFFMPGNVVSDVKATNITAIPVKAGVRYYFGTFYGAGEAGAISFIGNNRRTGFLYSLGMGDKFKLGKNVFDIGLRHEGWSTADGSKGIIGLRVAYEFKLNQKQHSRMPDL